MKKIAIFVEGLTELELTIRLLKGIAGARGISLEIMEQHSGKLDLVKIVSQEDSPFFALLVNCKCDNQVKSQIKEQHASLTKNGYSKIVGLRDVFPHGVDDLPKVQAYLATGLPTSGAPIDIVLAIMEVEAWFIEEVTHFSRLHKDMNEASILQAGFDIVNVRGHDWPNPAATLDSIYSAWGLRYTKQRNRIERTLDALDLDELYVNTRAKSSSLHQYIESIESALL